MRVACRRVRWIRRCFVRARSRCNGPHTCCHSARMTAVGFEPTPLRAAPCWCAYEVAMPASAADRSGHTVWLRGPAVAQSRGTERVGRSKCSTYSFARARGARAFGGGFKGITCRDQILDPARGGLQGPTSRPWVGVQGPTCRDLIVDPACGGLGASGAQPAGIWFLLPPVGAF